MINQYQNILNTIKTYYTANLAGNLNFNIACGIAVLLYFPYLFFVGIFVNTLYNVYTTSDFNFDINIKTNPLKYNLNFGEKSDIKFNPINSDDEVSDCLEPILQRKRIESDVDSMEDNQTDTNSVELNMVDCTEETREYIEKILQSQKISKLDGLEKLICSTPDESANSGSEDRKSKYIEENRL